MMKTMLDEDGGWDEEDIDEEEPVRPLWWSAKWIPLVASGGGDFQCLDLDPAPSGQMGQILSFGHDEGERPLLANSFVEWLTDYYHGLLNRQVFEYSDWEDVWKDDPKNVNR